MPHVQQPSLILPSLDHLCADHHSGDGVAVAYWREGAVSAAWCWIERVGNGYWLAVRDKSGVVLECTISCEMGRPERKGVCIGSPDLHFDNVYELAQSTTAVLPLAFAYNPSALAHATRFPAEPAARALIEGVDAARAGLEAVETRRPRN